MIKFLSDRVNRIVVMFTEGRMSKEVFCINCKFNWWGFCENPKGLHKVKTPYRIEEYFATQDERNANNNCPWFEDRRAYRPKGFFATVAWNVYKFITRRAFE